MVKWLNDVPECACKPVGKAAFLAHVRNYVPPVRWVPVSLMIISWEWLSGSAISEQTDDNDNVMQMTMIISDEYVNNHNCPCFAPGKWRNFISKQTSLCLPALYQLEMVAVRMSIPRFDDVG